MTTFFSRGRLTPRFLGKAFIFTWLFVAILTLIFIFRRPIVIKTIEHFSQPQNVKVSCLNFSINWQFNLKVQQACVNSPIGKLVVQNAYWQPWANIINIERVKIKHLKPQPENNNQQTSEAPVNTFNLATFWPAVNISSLELDSYTLLEPIRFALQTVAPNQLQLTGDLHASIDLAPNKLAAKLDWRLSDLTKYIPQAQALVKTLNQDYPDLLVDAALDEGKITSSLSYDGKTFQALNNLDIASRFKHTSCSIDALIKGNVLVDLDLTSLNMSVDLGQLTNTFSPIECPLLQDYFTKDDLAQLTFYVPIPVTINATHIDLPELTVIDKQNLNHTDIKRTIRLNNLNYKSTGELNVSYNMALKQSVQNKIFTAKMLDFQAQGSFSGNLLRFNGQAELSGKITSADLQVGDINLVQTSSSFSTTGSGINDLHLVIDNQISQLTSPDVNLQKLSNHLDLHVKNLDTLDIFGTSNFTRLSAANIHFQPIIANHAGQINLDNMRTTSQHTLKLEQGFSLAIQQQQNTAGVNIDISISQQEIMALQNIVTQLESALVVKAGTLSANLNVSLTEPDQTLITSGEVHLQQTSLKYQDYLVNNIDYQTPLTIDSAGLQLASSSLHIGSIDVGVPISQVKAQVSAKNNTLQLKQIAGEIFNGQFSLASLWLDAREQRLNVNFKQIDLAKVVALQQQPGLKITGTLDGEMPIIMDKQGIRVEDGWMSSLTGGKLTIDNNPSFDSIKAQQPELALLENLAFTQLESKVRFNPDGWMFFDFALQGNNPDKKQSVNFNYSHEENIFSLLESIRLVQSVENKIEQKITQGDKK